MRVRRLPASASRSVLMIGMPPPTAASKESCAPRSSASCASSTPWRGEQRLVGGHHALARCRAPPGRWHGPARPPRRSARRRRRWNWSGRGRPDRRARRCSSSRKPRSRARSRALTAVDPHRSAELRRQTSSPWRSSSRDHRRADRAQSRNAEPERCFIESLSIGLEKPLSALAPMGTTLCNVLSAEARKRPMLRAAWRMRCSFSTSAMRT